jgi:hypothetical protein
MPELLDRPKLYSLWMSNVLPSPSPSWELMATSDSHQDLELMQRRLGPITIRRRTCVIEGTAPPRWSPKP